MPVNVRSKVLESDKITVRMLLNHTSGIPEWLSPTVIEEIVSNPGKVWDVTEFLDLSARQSRGFAPGSGIACSNTYYNLLGEIIASATGRSWRDEVTKCLIEPFHLDNTLLPEPGDATIPGDHAHGYGGSAAAIVDPYCG
ncbi:MAG: beta-lactamase family protein [Chloroflexota bacterium]|nr:beta-lactamase family protein [Chloroflexota bacterium]